MPKVVKRTFSLTEEQAKFIDQQVESGSFATGSEVVRDGIRGLQEHEAAIKRWLEEEVVPTLRELDADPSRARPADEVFAEIYSEIEEQQKLRKRA